MAAIDFPDTPTTGQVFDKWTWNGTVWVLTAGAGGAPITAATHGTAYSMGGFPAGGYTYPAAASNITGYGLTSPLLPGGLTAWPGLWTVTAILVANPSDTGSYSLYLQMGGATTVFGNTGSPAFAVVSCTAQAVLTAGLAISWQMFKHSGTVALTSSSIRFVVSFHALT